MIENAPASEKALATLLPTKSIITVTTAGSITNVRAKLWEGELPLLVLT